MAAVWRLLLWPPEVHLCYVLQEHWRIEVSDLQYCLLYLKKGDVDSNQVSPCDDSQWTTRQHFGSKVFNDALKYLHFLDMVGAMKKAGWWLIGWVLYEPRRQFCCLANAAGPVSFHHAPFYITNGHKCTDLCHLQDCTNRFDNDDIVPDDEDDHDVENCDSW